MLIHSDEFQTGAKQYSLEGPGFVKFTRNFDIKLPLDSSWMVFSAKISSVFGIHTVKDENVLT